MLCILLLVPSRVSASTYTIPCSTSDLTTKFAQLANATSANTINLAEDCVYTFTEPYGSSDVGANGLQQLNHKSTGALTINGNGATIQRSSESGTPEFRLIEVLNGTLTINNLTLANGSASEIGGLWNYGGNVTLNNVTVTGNHADGDGGGIANSGTLILNNVLLANPKFVIFIA